jgi:hypothetical protein
MSKVYFLNTEPRCGVVHTTHAMYACGLRMLRLAARGFPLPSDQNRCAPGRCIFGSRQRACASKRGKTIAPSSGLIHIDPA